MRRISALVFIAASMLGSNSVSASQVFLDKRVVVAPGVSLRVLDANNASSKSPLVLIPGWSAGADIWRDQMERLNDNRRVLAFDPRSQGESTKTMSGNTPEQRAADLHELIAAERIARPVLVGWSQAAQDVAAYVTKYGTKDLSGIVLVDAAVADGADGIAVRPHDAAMQFGRFAYYTENQEDYLRQMFGYIITKPQPPGAVERLVATAMKTPPSIGISMLVADMFAIDRTPALRKIDCPVLIVAAGSSGELSRQQAEAKTIKNARFLQIADSAHAVFLDQPDRFASAVRDFFDEIKNR